MSARIPAETMRELVQGSRARLTRGMLYYLYRYLLAEWFTSPTVAEHSTPTASQVAALMDGGLLRFADGRTRLTKLGKSALREAGIDTTSAQGAERTWKDTAPDPRRRETVSPATPGAPQPLPCPNCGSPVALSEYSAYPQIACNDCYDGAPDSRSLIANEETVARCIESWNEQVEDRLADMEAERESQVRT